MITSTQPVCVVVPVYTTALAPHEWASLDRCVTILGKHPIILVKPVHLNISTILDKYPALQSTSFSDGYFVSIKSYNRMMLSDEFYARFAAYDFMLVHQLDSFVFSDQLLEWCERNYDYVGAPWIPSGIPPSKLTLFSAAIRRKYFRLTNRQYMNKTGDHHGQQHYSAGNGGFSLRKIASLRKLLSRMDKRVEPYRHGLRTPWSEDVFFSIEANRYKANLKIPNLRDAATFAWEAYPSVAAKFCKTALPFGFHAWHKLSDDEWENICRRSTNVRSGG